MIEFSIKKIQRTTAKYLGRVSPLPNSVRLSLLRAAGASIGNDVHISGNVHIENPHLLTIGHRTYIVAGCILDGKATITIGDDCGIAAGTIIVSTTHQIGTGDSRVGPGLDLAVSIGSGSWLGANVTVAAGVSIGKRCVVGAGSVVLQNCDDDGMYVGAPARRVRSLSDQD